MGELGLLGCFLVTIGAGAALLRCVQPLGDKPLFARFGWSFLAGAALVNLMLHLPLAIKGSISHDDFFTVFKISTALSVAALAVTLWKRRGKFDDAGPRWWALDLPYRMQFGVAMIVAFMAWFAASGPLTTYDSRAIYGLKAKVLYDLGSVHNEDFQDIDRLHYHPQYPLMLPLGEAYLFWAQGSADDDLFKWVGAAFTIALASVLVDQLRRTLSPSMAAIWGMALLATPMIITCEEGGGLSGSADIPFAAFLLAGITQLGGWLEDVDWRRAAIAGLMLGGALMLKQEGTVWVAGVSIAVAWLSWRTCVSWRSLSLAAVVGALVLASAVGLSAMARSGLVESPFVRDYGMALRFDWLSQLWRRPLELIPSLLRELAHTSSWRLGWPLLIAALCLKRPVAAPPSVRLLRLSLAGMSAVYLAVYIVTPYNLAFHIETSMSRLMLHLFPLALVVLAEQLSATGISAQIASLFAPAAKPTIEIAATRRAA